MPLATPEELLLHPPPPLPLWIRKPWLCGFPEMKEALLQRPEDQIVFRKPDTKSGKPGENFWVSNYGAQSWVLRCPYDEVMIGGERGGSKTAALIAWMAMGDGLLPKDDPAHYSYLLEPSYRGLVLRKEYQSLTEVVDEMTEFYGPLGGKAKDDPAEFHFKSGAKIYTNHLGDKNAFEKYRGLGITRIGIEELTQIEELRWYLKLLGSLRSKRQVRTVQTRLGPRQYPGLRAQIMSTANPDGDGKKWVKARFVKVLDGKGNPIPYNTPMRDPITGLTRIFIPMHRKDNPYLRDNKQYEGMLLSQDEATKQAWYYGNWNADESTFFTEWRPNGPVTAEEKEKYPWARHVIEPILLRPWLHRWGGGDFGYDHPAAFHKFCRNDRDGRIHVYEELMLRETGSFEMGVRLANWWLPDLEYLPDKSVTIAFSSDAFSKTDDTRTKAEQIAAGIASVLGPYGAFLLKFTDEERLAMSKDPALAERKLAQHRDRAQGKFFIVLKPASKDTEARWGYMRELLRFRPVVQETEDELKERLRQTFSRSEGDRSSAVYAYEKELSKVKRHDSENLPKLQIWNGRCPELVRCMEEATKDEDHPNRVKKWNASDGRGGDDALESCFVAGTLVETEYGPRPIDSIRVGELVWTRDGLMPVTNCGITSDAAAVSTMELSNGIALTGTPNHPIFNPVSGFARLDSFGYGDMVEIWHSTRQSFSMESNFGATQNRRALISGTTTGQEGITASVESDRSTKRYGSLLMDRYLPDSTSTIRTKIPLIMTSLTWRQNSGPPITESILRQNHGVHGYGRFSPLDLKRPQNGTAPRQAGNWGEKMESALWRCANWLVKTATSAAYAMKRNGQTMLSFAPISVKRRHEETATLMTSKKRVNYVAQGLQATSSRKSDSAPVRVVRVGATGTARVYNLAVFGTPEYYANGILVHNCGHGLHHFKDIEKVMPKSYYVTDRVEQVQVRLEKETGERLTDPNRLIMVHKTAEARYEKLHPKNSGSFYIPRASSMRHRAPAATKR